MLNKLMDIYAYFRERVNFILPILLVLIAVSIIGFFVLITSIFWIPFLILNLPILIPSAIIAYYVPPIRLRVKTFYLRVYDWVFYGSEKPRRFLWELLYNTMLFLYPQSKWKTMNYGYAVLNADGELIKLDKEDEEERFCLQLYHYVATAVPKEKELKDKVVIEIGSGRGGGLFYIAKYLKPKKCIGIDISINQIKFCQKNYASMPNLSFYHGDSENLGAVEALKDEQADLVINVESSHCYGNFKAFVAGVEKLLRPGGHFVVADFLEASRLDEYRSQFDGSSFKLVNEEDITSNVSHALKLDEERRKELIKNYVHKVFRPFFFKFSGLSGSRIKNALDVSETVYVVFVLQKQKDTKSN